MFKKLNMILGKQCLKGCRKINGKRLSPSKYDNPQATNKRRKIRRGKAKVKYDKHNDKEGQSYEAGAF